MANVPLKSIKFPGLSDTYTVPQIDALLSTAGKAADAKATGDAIALVKGKLVQTGHFTDWVNGAVSPAGGYNNVPTSGNTRIRLNQRISSRDGILKLEATTGYVFMLFAYKYLGYALTEDGTFVEGRDYYTKNSDGTYTLATVTPGEEVTANTYYEYCVDAYQGYYNTNHVFSKSTANALTLGIWQSFDDFGSFPDDMFFKVVLLKSDTDVTPADADKLTYTAAAWARIEKTKTMYALGDSITKGVFTRPLDSSGRLAESWSYPYWIGAENGYSVKNLGRSGAGWVNKSTDTGNENAKDLVDNNTFTDADIITLLFGVNDWKAATPVTLGSIETSTAGDGTVIGNMMYVIETLAGTKAPQAAITVLLPLNYARTVGSIAPDIDDNWGYGTAVNDGLTLQDYRDAIKACAEHYNVNVIDAETVSAINRFNIWTCLGDGAHPTLPYHEQLGKALAPYIR